MKQRFPKTILPPLSNVSPAARQNVPWFGVALMLLHLLPFDQVRSAWGAADHGQVVDAETGKPIEGAVVMVEWHKKAIYEMDGGGRFHNARETLTDAEGKFSLDSSEGINWNPLTIVQAQIIAFYPGYRAFTAAHPEDIGTKSDLYKIAEAFERGVDVNSNKVNFRKGVEALYNRSGFGLIMAPYTVVPNLLRLINIQRKLLGIDEFKLP